MMLLILFFVFSIVLSFLCSIWEAVILSVTPSHVSAKLQEGSKIGILLRNYKEDIDRPLAAILTLNTIAHTAGAVGVGSQAGKLFGTVSFDIGIGYVSYESIIAGAMTLAILVLSEIIPKTIGANKWKQLTPFTVRSVGFLMIVLAPFVWLAQWITRNLMKDKTRSVFSRADLAAMTLAGLESGALDKSESTIIQNLLFLRQLHVSDIMTPRSVMLMADEHMNIGDFYARHHDLPFSRIPVYDGRPDHVTGMILKSDLLQQVAEDQAGRSLTSLKRDVLIVKDFDPLPKLMQALVRERAHIAVVMDKYGSVVGIVTMEDLFETIMGFEIVDETDKIADLQGYARKQWEKRARKMGIVPPSAETEAEPD